MPPSFFVQAFGNPYGSRNGVRTGLGQLPPRLIPACGKTSVNRGVSSISLLRVSGIAPATTFSRVWRCETKNKPRKRQTPEEDNEDSKQDQNWPSLHQDLDRHPVFSSHSLVRSHEAVLRWIWSSLPAASLAASSSWTRVRRLYTKAPLVPEAGSLLAKPLRRALTIFRRLLFESPDLPKKTTSHPSRLSMSLTRTSGRTSLGTERTFAKRGTTYRNMLSPPPDITSCWVIVGTTLTTADSSVRYQVIS